MLQKAVTSLNEDASELLIEVHEQLNEYVAASFIDAPVVKSEVHCDEGGMAYVKVSFGGPGVLAKRAAYEKDPDKMKEAYAKDAEKTAKERGERLAAAAAKAKAGTLPAQPPAKPEKPEEEEDEDKPAIGAGAGAKPRPGQPLHK